MVKANGRVAKVLSAMPMKATTFKIRNTGMESLHGRVGIFIKENTKMMKEMAMVR
jgi:hypothetical protein